MIPMDKLKRRKPMRVSPDETLSDADDDGWHRYTSARLPVPVDFRWERNAAGRILIVAVRVESPDGIDGTVLRSIPISAVEAKLNQLVGPSAQLSAASAHVSQSM